MITGSLPGHETVITGFRLAYTACFVIAWVFWLTPVATGAYCHEQQIDAESLLAKNFWNCPQPLSISYADRQRDLSNLRLHQSSGSGDYGECLH